MSGMDELLDEAIAKAKEVGDSQLVEWLRMARGGKSAARWYAAKLRDLEAENAKLRELAKGMYGLLETYDKIMGSHDACETPRPLIFDGCKSFKDVARELGIEVD